MDGRDPEVFGTDAQTALLRKAHALYQLVKDDPRFTYYGRNVGLATPQDGDLSQLAALAHLQAASHYGRVPGIELPSLTAAADEAGLSTTHYARWCGASDALAAARDIRENLTLAPDLTLHRIDARAPHDRLAKLAEIALACGVLPISGAVLRGVARPGVGLVATDANGTPVACAAAASYGHPDHPHDICWWGMLATHPDRRGERLALLLGAYAMLDMHDRFGATRFFTGVEAGNAPSEAVCARMGLAPDGTHTLSVADAAQLPGGRMTK